MFKFCFCWITILGIWCNSLRKIAGCQIVHAFICQTQYYYTDLLYKSYCCITLISMCHHFVIEIQEKYVCLLANLIFSILDVFELRHETLKYVRTKLKVPCGGVSS